MSTRIPGPILFAAALIAAAPPGHDFRIGAVAFAPADILDARALPVPDAPPVIMLTFADAALPKLAEATRSDMAEADVPVSLDGKLLTRLIVHGSRHDPVLTIGGVRTLPEAERIAKEISGKDPLPDSLDQ